MTTEKTYTQSQVKNIVDWYEKENKKLRDFKDQITWIIDRHVSSNTSDENMLKEIEKMAIQKMLEDNGEHDFYGVARPRR